MNSFSRQVLCSTNYSWPNSACKWRAPSKLHVYPSLIGLMWALRPFILRAIPSLLILAWPLPELHNKINCNLDLYIHISRYISTLKLCIYRSFWPCFLLRNLRCFGMFASPDLGADNDGGVRHPVRSVAPSPAPAPAPPRPAPHPHSPEHYPWIYLCFVRDAVQCTKYHTKYQIRSDRSSSNRRVSYF